MRATVRDVLGLHEPSVRDVLGSIRHGCTRSVPTGPNGGDLARRLVRRVIAEFKMGRPPNNAQLSLALPPPPRKKGKWGGKRAGAGRPKTRKPGDPLPHVARPPLRRSDPVHVTLRAVRTLPSLRSEVAWNVVRRALEGAREAGEKRAGARFQVVHFSVQKDHVHLIVEAADKRALTSGVAGLEVRIARAVNGVLRRRGRVWGDRYHRHDLRSPREVRNALRYVLSNGRKHARVTGAAAFAAPWSSAETFDGWSERVERLHRAAAASEDTEPWKRVYPRTWLLGKGWRRHGLISPREGPGPRVA
jgi:putative transposase